MGWAAIFVLASANRDGERLPEEKEECEMSVREKLDEYPGARMAELRRLKDEGAKIVGITPGGYLPEELVNACGAIPVGLLRGGDHEAVAVSGAYIPRFIDTFCRSQIGYRTSEEEPLYQMVDLVVSPLTDANHKAIADCWDFYTDVDIFWFGVPQNKTDHGFEYYLEGIGLLREKLEEVTGNKITDERLREAIDLYNRMRDLLEEISLMRKSQDPPISGKEFVTLNHTSFNSDKVVLIEMLESLLQELKEKGAPSLKGPRVLMIGSTLALGDYKVLDLVEEAGGVVVMEEFAEGVRHTRERVKTNGDLMEALADRYFRRRIPPAWFRPAKERLDYLMGLAKEFSVDGILWYQLMYRDGYDIESTYFEKRLKKETGIPMLKIESDYDVSEKGPFRTRIETFVETLKRR